MHGKQNIKHGLRNQCIARNSDYYNCVLCWPYCSQPLILVYRPPAVGCWRHELLQQPVAVQWRIHQPVAAQWRIHQPVAAGQVHNRQEPYRRTVFCCTSRNEQLQYTGNKTTTPAATSGSTWSSRTRIMCNFTLKLRANNNHVTDRSYWLRYKASRNTQTFSRYFEAGLIGIVLDLPWLRRLGNKLSLRRSGLNHSPVHVGFMADRVALEQDFFTTIQFSPVNVSSAAAPYLFSFPLSMSVPPLLHTYSSIHLSPTLYNLSSWQCC